MASGIGNVVPLEDVLQEIGGVYERIAGLVNAGGELSPGSLAKISERYFREKYGGKMGQRKMIHFVHGVQAHSRMCARIRWFGIFFGYLKAQMYDVEVSQDMLMNGLVMTCKLLCEAYDGHQNIKMNFSQKLATISKDKISTKVKSLFPNSPELDLQTKSSSNGNISLDYCLDAVIGNYYGMLDATKSAASLLASDEDLRKAATSIQSSWRGKQAKRKMEEKRNRRKEENDAAAKIQAIYRGKASREEVKKKRRSIVSGNTASYETEQLTTALKRQEKYLREELGKVETERKRWQKAFSKMESKYRATKKRKDEYKTECSVLQEVLEAAQEKITELETDNAARPRSESIMIAEESELVQDLKNQLLEKEVQIRELERSLAGSRASSKWSRAALTSRERKTSEKLEQSHMKVKDISEDLEVRVRRLQVELSKERNENSALRQKREEQERMRMWMESSAETSNMRITELEKNEFDCRSKLNIEIKKVQASNRQNNHIRAQFKAFWYYSVWRFLWIVALKERDIKKLTTSNIWLEQELKQTNIQLSEHKLILKDTKEQLNIVEEDAEKLKFRLCQSEQENSMLRDDIQTRIQEVSGLNDDINKLSQAILALNEQIKDLIKERNILKENVIAADEKVKRHLSREEFALIRLRASEVRRLEIERSFGFLARPSNDTASKIVDLSRSLTRKEINSIGGKELDPIQSTANATYYRELHLCRTKAGKGQFNRSNALAGGKSVMHSLSLPLLNASGTVDMALPKGAIIVCVMCDERTVREIWETCRPLNVIQILSMNAALAYFKKPVENVAMLPNMVIGDIHLSTADGQGFLGYLKSLRIPLVLIGTKSQEKNAKLFNAVDFVRKPANPICLRRAFNTAMHSQPRSRKYALEGLESTMGTHHLRTVNALQNDAPKRLSKLKKKPQGLLITKQQGASPTPVLQSEDEQPAVDHGGYGRWETTAEGVQKPVPAEVITFFTPIRKHPMPITATTERHNILNF